MNESNQEKSIRLIFEKVDPKDYLEHENKYYYQFKEFFEQNYKDKIILPDYWTETQTRKCLQVSKWDFDKTIEKMKSIIETIVPKKEYSEIEEIVKSGYLYMHGMDKFYHPIVVVNAEKFIAMMDKYPLDNFLASMDLFMQYLFKHIFIPGQIENWIMIVDVQGMSIFKPPLKLFTIFKFLQTKYCCRLKALYIVGINYILRCAWALIKHVVDERTAKKFNFFSGKKDLMEIILKDVHPSQLEEKYGGTCENKEKFDFPFILPSHQYQIESEDNPSVVNEEKYLELVDQKKIVTLSPYLIQEGKIRKPNQEFKIANNYLSNGMKYNENSIKIGDEEFFECKSNNSFEPENNQIKDSELTKSDKNKSSYINAKIKKKKVVEVVRKKKNKLTSSRKKSLSNSTIFEGNEDIVNRCQCKQCIIF